MPDRFDILLPPESESWEACARHQNRATTRRISTLFLCDECARRLTRDCFNDRPPIYHGFADGLTFDGYCAFCSQVRRVTIRQWFLCAICENVVLSYPKTIVASQLVHNYWRERVTARLPYLALEEHDVVQIEPYVARRRSQRAKAETLESLDFLVTDLRDNRPLFLIELKAGPSPLSGEGAVREFQLDVNDYIDIVTVARKLSLPVYVFHAQVVDQYGLPTRRSVGRNVWWTNIFSLRSALKSVKRRRGEDKNAGYYHPSAFKPIDSFIEELKNEGYKALTERLIGEGIEDLPTSRDR